MTASRVLWAVALLLFVSLIAGSLAVYPTLPEQVPTGLDANGMPRGLSPRSLLSWLALPLIMGSVTILTGVLSAVIHRFPNGLNVPGGELWRTLPLESRRRTAEPVRALMGFIGAFTMGLGVVIQYGLYQAALGRSAGWVMPVTLILGVLPIPVGLGIILRNFEDDVKAELKRIQANAGTNAGTNGGAKALVVAALCTMLAAPVVGAQGAAGPATVTPPDVAFDVPVAGVTLSGTLRLPEGARRPPVVILVAGSGPTDRDGNNPMGLRPNTLRQLAESLSAAGIASYRYDKRGVARSVVPGMREQDLRFEHYAQDISAIVRALAADGRTGRAVIAGHSEGAMLGLLAALEGGVAGYVSIAGIARPAHEVLHDQLAAQLPPAMLAAADSALAQLAAGRTLERVPPGLEALFRPSVQPYLISWFPRSAEAEIRKWTGPCLLVQGAHDIQVAVAEFERLAAAQPRCGRLLVPGMNHVLKDAPAERMAQMASYGDPSLPLSAGVAARLIAFVRDVTR